MWAITFGSRSYLRCPLVFPSATSCSKVFPGAMIPGADNPKRMGAPSQRSHPRPVPTFVWNSLALNIRFMPPFSFGYFTMARTLQETFLRLWWLWIQLEPRGLGPRGPPEPRGLGPRGPPEPRRLGPKPPGKHDGREQRFALSLSLSIATNSQTSKRCRVSRVLGFRVTRPPGWCHCASLGLPVASRCPQVPPGASYGTIFVMNSNIFVINNNIFVINGNIFALNSNIFVINGNEL